MLILKHCATCRSYTHHADGKCLRCRSNLAPLTPAEPGDDAAELLAGGAREVTARLAEVEPSYALATAALKLESAKSRPRKSVIKALRKLVVDTA